MSSPTRVVAWSHVSRGWMAIACAGVVLAAEPANSTKPTISRQQFTAAADYSARNFGAAVLVMQHGKILFERYETPATVTTAIHLHSGTKGFWGPAIAAMIEDGLVTSF